MTMLRIDRVKARQRQMNRRSVIHRGGGSPSTLLKTQLVLPSITTLPVVCCSAWCPLYGPAIVQEGTRGVISSHWLFQSPGPTSSVLGAGTTGTGARAIGTRLSAVRSSPTLSEKKTCN
jgi:hypothetical protein